jgi:hypothetical protein
VGPRAVLDAVVKRKIPSPCRESNPRTPIVQPVSCSNSDRNTDYYDQPGLLPFSSVAPNKFQDITSKFIERGYPLT